VYPSQIDESAREENGDDSDQKGRETMTRMRKHYVHPQSQLNPQYP
jgi:hypothetical protein